MDRFMYVWMVVCGDGYGHKMIVDCAKTRKTAELLAKKECIENGYWNRCWIKKKKVLI